MSYGIMHRLVYASIVIQQYASILINCFNYIQQICVGTELSSMGIDGNECIESVCVCVCDSCIIYGTKFTLHIILQGLRC